MCVWGGSFQVKFEAAVDGCQRKFVPIEVHAFVKQRDWSVGPFSVFTSTVYFLVYF